MNDQYVRNVIEAALLAAGRPLSADELIGLFDERDGSNAAEVAAAIEVLRADYEGRGLELVEVASGFRIQIRAAVAQPVSRLWQERPAKYSRALLETRTSSRRCSNARGFVWSAIGMCRASQNCWAPRVSFSIISDSRNSMTSRP